jgi:hypothetical protein
MDTLSLDNLLHGSNEITIEKNTVLSGVKTLESYHEINLKQILDDKESLVDLEKQLEDKKQELIRIEKQFEGPSFIRNAADIGILTCHQRLHTEIKNLESRIQSLKNGTAVADYFLRVGDVLFSYADAQERIAIGENPVEVGSRKGRVPANSVYSYFSSNNECPAHPTIDSTSTPPSSKASMISNTIGFKRDKALEHYLSALDPDSIHHDSAVAGSIETDYGNCPICETEMFFNDTFLDCPECGYRDCILVDSEKPSYKDPPREMSYYAYKKINHLNEWLAQFQAKETTEISAATLDLIRAELKKERITDMSKLKPSKLKEVIKKLKLNRCYDHVAHVLNRLNGISAPVLSREIEEKLRFMFKEIQFSFVKHCPKKRSNFLSYSFVLYKFCELLELDDYLPCFPLLKSREKLYMQDKIWQKICEDMNWQFIRTV